MRAWAALGAIAALAAAASSAFGDQIVAGDKMTESSTQGVYYVSAEGGEDASPGTEARPFRTIERAQQEVRNAVAAGMTGDVVVVLRGGKYHLERALHFDARDSGRDGYRVVYRSHPGERAEIIGGKPVTGWEPDGGGVYRARVGEGRVFSALFENGEWCTPARTPNEGYLRAAGGSDEDGRYTVVFREGDLPQDADYRHAQLAIWAGAFEDGSNYDWWETLAPIERIDWASRTIALGTGTFWRASKNNRFYVQGSKAFLDRPGEWHLDREAGMLYYWPRRTPIEEQEIIAPTTARILDLQGSALERLVENVTFEDLELSCSDSSDVIAPGASTGHDGMVYVRNGRNLRFRGCRLRNAGVHGMAFYEYNQGHVISDCLIEGAGFHALILQGFPVGGGPFQDPEAAYVSKGFLITNNYLRGCGRRVGQGSGVFLSQSGDHEISHNLFEDMPRYGVNMTGDSYQFMMARRGPDGPPVTFYGREVTWDNHLDFLYTRNIRIVQNEFRDLMKDSQDGGAITTWAPGADNLIAGNLIHSMKAFHSANYGIMIGIYLDDASKHFTVRDNVICRLEGSDAVYPMCIKGIGNVVTNNVIADNEAAASFYTLEAGIAGLPDSIPGVEDERVEALTYSRNIVRQIGGRTVYKLYPWRETLIKEADHNLYYHPEGTYEVIIDWRSRPWEHWRGLLGGRLDQHSLLADPQFVDPEHFDYRLKPGSPALELGIESIDVSGVGVRPDFPFIDEVKKANRKYGR